jgi:hypothetical protein
MTVLGQHLFPADVRRANLLPYQPGWPNRHFAAQPCGMPPFLQRTRE